VGRIVHTKNVKKELEKLKKKEMNLSRISSEEVELKKDKIAKRIEGGKKKVSRKRKATQTYKWIKQFYVELDDIKKRLDLIEEFLGGRESMQKVLEKRMGMKEFWEELDRKREKTSSG